jgi:hypothetical protein
LFDLLSQLNIVLVDHLNVIHSIEEKKENFPKKIKRLNFSFTRIGSVVDDDIV